MTAGLAPPNMRKACPKYAKVSQKRTKRINLSNHTNIKQALCCVRFNLDVKLSTFRNKIDCRAFTCRFRASLKHFLSAVFAFCIAYCFLTDFLSSFAQGLFLLAKLVLQLCLNICMFIICNSRFLFLSESIYAFALIEGMEILRNNALFSWCFLSYQQL